MRSKLFKHAIDSSASGMALLRTVPGRAPVVIYVNLALEALTGFHARELTGRQWWWPVGTDEEGPVRCERPDGQVRWIESHIAPFDAGHGVAVVHDVTAAHLRVQQLEHRACHDALTGLANRYLLDDRLDQAIAHAQRRGQGFSLVLLDLDDFKDINDRFGHPVGDEALRRFAGCLTAVLRAGDTAVRLGGDEFALLLTDAAGAAEARSAVERIACTLRAPLMLDGHPCLLSFSAGVSLFPAHGIDASDLIRNADISMYRHKRTREGSAAPSWTVTRNVVAYG